MTVDKVGWRDFLNNDDLWYFKTEIQKNKITFEFSKNKFRNLKTKPLKNHCITHRIVKDNGMSFTSAPTHTPDTLLLKSSNLSATDHPHHEPQVQVHLCTLCGGGQ